MNARMTGAAAAFAALFLTTISAHAAGMLTAQNGMTLYTFDKDEGGMSACYDQCAVAWPPYMASADEKMGDEWTKVERKDGSMQWAYDGKPVYFFKDDAAKGDMKGDGLKDVWHIIKE